MSSLVGNVNPVDSKSAPGMMNIPQQYPHWKNINPDSDSSYQEWQSNLTCAVISISSACRNNLDGSDLRVITQDLLSQWQNLKIISEKDLTVSGHPAFETVARGTYLKNSRKLKTVIIKSPSCIYDLIFLSPITTFDQDRSVFDQFRDNLILK